MPSRHVAAFTFLISALALFGACNGQSEGMVCDPRNGNSDCQNGYRCIVSPTLGSMAGDRCCPGDLALATTFACGLHQGGVTDASSAAPPTDASLGDEDATTVPDGDATTSGDALEDAPSSDDGSDGG
jgi:hypothetical protein